MIRAKCVVEPLGGLRYALEASKHDLPISLASNLNQPDDEDE